MEVSDFFSHRSIEFDGRLRVDRGGRLLESVGRSGFGGINGFRGGGLIGGAGAVASVLGRVLGR